jgi:acetoin utilization protein AcuB
MIAREAMTPAPLTVTRRTSVAAALRLVRDNAISRLPVVERGLIVGVVRREQLLTLTPSEATTLSRHELHDALARLTVERAVAPTLTLPADTPLAEAARRLLAHDVSEALIVEDGRLEGILTHSDILRALVPAHPEATV